MAKIKIAISRRSMIGIALAAGALAGFPQQVIAKPSFPHRGQSRGRVAIRNKMVNWRSETGETVFHDLNNHPLFTVFSADYLAVGEASRTRPVTFIWNGGPGGATWHLREHLSPRITVAANNAPGFKFVDNIHSIIDKSDLVFIDAPGTGFSRILDPGAKKICWGVEEDGQVFADFILRWLKRHRRTTSPIFLIGESYGGTRAGQVARNLAERGIALAGVTLVSPTLSPLGGTHNWHKSYSPAANLPGLAAVAHFHGKGSHSNGSTDDAIADAVEFAQNHYAPALERLPDLQLAERETLAGRIAGFVGLSSEEILEDNLAVPVEKFLSRLLVREGKILDIGDGRIARPAPKAGEAVSVLTPDATFDRTKSIEDLIRHDLGFNAVGPYKRDPMEIARTWNQDVAREGRTHVIFAELMAQNPKLQVLNVTGFYDLIVPFMASNAQLQATLPSERLELRTYQTGHGVYEDVDQREKATQGLASFYEKVLK